MRDNRKGLPEVATEQQDFPSKWLSTAHNFLCDYGICISFGILDFVIYCLIKILLLLLLLSTTFNAMLGAIVDSSQIINFAFLMAWASVEISLIEEVDVSKMGTGSLNCE